MEPTLFHGDILVVRKADGFWQRLKMPASFRMKEGKNNHESIIDNDEHAIKRERILAYERQHCNSNGHIGLLRKPPTPVTGDIVIFKSPDKYPDQWSIKRTIAIGGESVVTRLRTSNAVRQGRVQTESAYVPPYCIWVEGDNSDKSVDSFDSRSHGPLSKKLLVGIAEYRLWPPWRAGKLDNKCLSDASSTL